jgi:hypothetical protein
MWWCPALKHLVEVLEIIRDTGTGLYIHTQSADTTTRAGRAMFGMLGIYPGRQLIARAACQPLAPLCMELPPTRIMLVEWKRTPWRTR